MSLIRDVLYEAEQDIMAYGDYLNGAAIRNLPSFYCDYSD